MNSDKRSSGGFPFFFFLIYTRDIIFYAFMCIPVQFSTEKMQRVLQEVLKFCLLEHPYWRVLVEKPIRQDLLYQLIATVFPW